MIGNWKVDRGGEDGSEGGRKEDVVVLHSPDSMYAHTRRISWSFNLECAVNG